MQNAKTMQYEKLRRFERKPFTEVIAYSLSVKEDRKRKWIDLNGKALNISEAGICIETEYPLTPGHMLWFKNGFDKTAGFVRWSARYNDRYRAGIELDGKNIRQLDEATDIFIKRLEEIEKRCDNPNEKPEDIMASIEDAFNDVLNSCRLFEIAVNDEEIIKDARVRFHQKTNKIFSKSFCINRARIWPQGYQGDYKTLETIYRNTPLSKGFGYYLDLYCLGWPLGTGVRNRLNELKNILKEEISQRQKPKVLNIACGSCREVFELSSLIEKSGTKITCIDLDDDALAFAANRLSFTNLNPVFSNQVVLRKYNAIRMFDNELNMAEFGKQDIIYSVGLFDYLESEFLVKLFSALYELLNPGGVLITSFKDSMRYRSQEYHWIVDWDGFLQRTEEDFVDIFTKANIPLNQISEQREKTGLIVFYLIKK